MIVSVASAGGTCSCSLIKRQQCYLAVTNNGSPIPDSPKRVAKP